MSAIKCACGTEAPGARYVASGSRVALVLDEHNGPCGRPCAAGCMSLGDFLAGEYHANFQPCRHCAAKEQAR